MRSVVCAVAALGAVMGWAGSVTAAPAGTATIGLVAAGEMNADEREALAAIIAEVERRMDAARDPIEKGHLSQLSGHYREEGVVPHWTNAGGLTDAGRAIYEELAKADQYGLDPAQFRLPVLPVAAASLAERAAAEVDLSPSAVRYRLARRGGRIDATQLSRWLDASPKPIYANDVFRAIAVMAAMRLPSA